MASPIGYSVDHGTDFDSRLAVSSAATECPREDIKSVKKRIENCLDMLTSHLGNLSLTTKKTEKKQNGAWKISNEVKNEDKEKLRLVVIAVIRAMTFRQSGVLKILTIIENQCLPVNDRSRPPAKALSQLKINKWTPSSKHLVTYSLQNVIMIGTFGQRDQNLRAQCH